ncbi:3-keto-5-aminohexanoate cleavage protein [Anaerocolumna sedimenticola]|uniref:3-keto-5-aminohexanoate cleavage protein n=1 Tax=Anaerocolumna sedimenticola TaxID=2696063 RepID=A0A6P1TMD2_9FIRM|nr:3-keto-5-aminohexanoate cleavage protein [Anaerocolumna sedimenticola]QHQ61016.1 3-keto-5-aminohexanoate cleavage protein [Anaerocolumna sedimenticola]
MRKVIISLAPIPGPAAPVHIEAIAEDVAKSIDAGAGMCHIHCKDMEGVLTPDIAVITELFESITRKRDVVVQASTGGISNMTIKERCNPLNYRKVESASLNGGTTNLGEAVYINSFDDIRYLAKVCYEKNILPEIEVFDIGMINNVNLVRQGTPFHDPVLFNLVFGHMGGMQPTIEALTAFRSFVPQDCLWGVTHFGRDNWTFLAAAIAMGATVVRIGFEDSPYLDENTDAEYNYQVVEKLVHLIRVMGLEPATPKETRDILRIAPIESLS